MGRRNYGKSSPAGLTAGIRIDIDTRVVRTLGYGLCFLHYLPALEVQEISKDMNFSDLNKW